MRKIYIKVLSIKLYLFKYEPYIIKEVYLDHRYSYQISMDTFFYVEPYKNFNFVKSQQHFITCFLNNMAKIKY